MEKCSGHGRYSSYATASAREGTITHHIQEPGTEVTHVKFKDILKCHDSVHEAPVSGVTFTRSGIPHKSCMYKTEQQLNQ